GQAETVHVNVATAKPGVVASLQVDLLQPVKQGDIVAHVLPADLEAFTADLAANVEALRAQLRQTSDRNIVNYQELRLDWLRRNVELASARVEQQLAESDYQRYAALHANRTVSDADFEMRRANRDGLRGKVSALEQLSSDLQKEIARMTPDAAEQSPADRAISAAAFAQQKQLEALSAAATLRSPMDGIVTTIVKRPGENVLAGEFLLTIGALQASRIVGYVRQPLNTPVKTGDTLAVASRTAHRTTATARVLGVGTQLELIDPGLLPTSASSVRVAEYGLPFLLEIPAALHLAPGEIVNISPRSRL
ncbi:MAG: HlyD family efflux transporter periplasmic adaptor subunit, partial [Opitutaceae bacterium]